MEKKDDFLQLLNTRVKLSDRFLKRWRDDVKKWINDYNIETITSEKLPDISNAMQIPYIFSTVEQIIPSSFDRIPDVIMKQRGKEDRPFTEFTGKIWDYIKERTHLVDKLEEVGYNMVITGIGTVKYGWTQVLEEVEEKQEQPITNSDGTPVLDETGQPVTQVVIQKVQVPIKDLPYVRSYNYKEIYYSPESKFVLDDEENEIPYIICKRTISPEQVLEDYGKKPSEESISKLNLSEIDGSADDSLKNDKTLETADLDRVDVFEYCGTLPKEFIKKAELKEKWNAQKVYYVVFTKKEIIKEPEEMAKKPYLQIGNYGLPTTFIRFGEPKVMRELEHDISLGRSRVMDLRDKQGVKIWVPSTIECDEKKLKNPKDFTLMRGTSQQPPQYITPPPVPETIMTALEQSRQDIQMASSMLDISRASSSNTVDTATGQKIFAEASNKKIQRKKQKMGEFMKALAKNLLPLCAFNWDITVFAKITDMDPAEIEQNGYIENLKNLGEEYDIEMDVESMNENKETIAAQAIALYREMKEDPGINHEELVKHVMKVGFGYKDAEQFLSGVVSPETVLASLESLVQSGVLQPEQAQQLAVMYGQVTMQQQAQGGQEGRPGTQNPVDAAQKTMKSDNTQIAAQTGAAYKQQGVAKGPQGV